MTKLTIRTALMIAASSLPIAANAQDASADGSANAANAEDVIVVTGSRISRDPNIGSPAPVTSLSSEQLTEAGSSDVVDSLRDVPSLTTSTSADGSIDGVFSQGVGQSVLNLRGLGDNRTLVLVNGRRHVSGVDGRQTVDVNSIPSALVERVEILTGGASAVYGADAVTGVVNFRLREDFDGVEANAQTGISHKGDGWRFNGDLTWGKNFADGRGNIVISGEYARNDELQFGDRSFSRNNGIADDQGNPARRFQAGDIDPATMPNFAAFFAVGSEGFPSGFNIPTPGSGDYTTIFTDAGITPTPAEQALIDRAANAPSRFIARDPRFSLSSAGGVVAPGDIGNSDGPDINNNGVADCLESSVGFNSTFNPGAFGLAGGCAVINPDGSLSVYQDGQITGLFNQFGGQGIQNNFDTNSLIPETERWSVNLNARYEFSEAAEIFFEGKYSSNRAEYQSQPNTFYDLLTIRADNPYLTPELQQFVGPLFFGENGQEGLYITRDPTDLGANRDRSEYETLRFVGGLKGQMTDHLRYELSVNFGRTNTKVFDANRVILDRWYAAIDVTTDPNTGQPICRSDIDTTPPATTPFGIPAGDPGFYTFNPGDGQCRPANILGGVGAISPEAVDFITQTTLERHKLEQFVISGILVGDTGAFLNLPGGPVDFVVGTEFRKETSDSVFDPLVLGVVPVTTAFANAGQLIRDVPDAGMNSLVFDPASTINNSGGKFDVAEFYGELRLPILSDKPFAYQLEFNAAARYANYSTVGSAFTWSINGIYAPSPDILFRGTYAQAVRAPNINELFNPAQGEFFRPVDPCDVAELGNGADPALRQRNCEAFFAGIGFNPNFGPMGSYAYVDPLTARFSGSESGNPDLQEETARTYTVGAQFSPGFIPGLVLSVDYYNIKLDDAISTVSDQDIVDNCVDSSSIDNQFCPLIDRNPATGGFTFLRQTSINFAKLETSGVEASMTYGFDLGEHRFNLAAGGTWVRKLDRFFDPADPTFVDPELGELQRPEWAGNVRLNWQWDKLRLGWSMTYLDSMALRSVEIEDIGSVYSAENALTDSTFIHDISFNFDMNDNFDLYGGVNNIFNETPFITEQAYPVSPRGTYFYIGAKASF